MTHAVINARANGLWARAEDTKVEVIQVMNHGRLAEVECPSKMHEDLKRYAGKRVKIPYSWLTSDNPQPEVEVNTQPEVEAVPVPSVRDILEDYLRVHGYDGLCGDECGCGLDDLMPCGEVGADCQPAYRHSRLNCRVLDDDCVWGAECKDAGERGGCWRTERQP